MSATTIEVRGLEVYAYHGVLESERQQGQRFLFDVWLEGLPAAASESDRLEDAVDYSAVCDRVVQLATETRYALLERLATVVATDLRARFGVGSVRVRVAKPQVPIRHHLAEVAVTAEAPARAEIAAPVDRDGMCRGNGDPTRR